MEHRWSVRKAIAIGVSVETHAGPFRAVARDVSLEGMFLEPEGRVPETGTVVELVFSLGDRGSGHRYRIKAFVVRADARGFGVLFLEFVAVAFRDLEQLLYSTA